MARLIIPEISAKVEDDVKLYLKCERCDNGIEFNSERQRLISKNNGAGHQCTYCGDFYILVICSECEEQYTLNHYKWDAYRKGKEFLCEECGSSLKSNFFVRDLEINSAQQRCNPVPSGNFDYEKKYLKYALAKISDERKYYFSQVHGGINTRINIVRRVIKEIDDNGFSGWEIYTSENDIHPTGKIIAEESAFIISNSLISILDVFSHEMVMLSGFKVNPRDISFNNLISNKWTIGIADGIHELCCCFKNKFSYKYLCRLRNCLQHRYSIPIVRKSTFKLEIPGSISDFHLPSEHKIYLPDNPQSMPENITYNKEYLFEDIFLEIQKDIIDLISEIYKLISIENRIDSMGNE
ncbi:hypothetical protein ACQUQP_16450 [Marinobacterium sp. YM272]|uniref:hypothetical protein n=1 Tax=Marinobacterium sp. YM272 TaxID=3421654 RepID=UPI003D7FE307